MIESVNGLNWAFELLLEKCIKSVHRQIMMLKASVSSDGKETNDGEVAEPNCCPKTVAGVYYRDRHK
jgi:hypothetical protein